MFNYVLYIEYGQFECRDRHYLWYHRESLRRVGILVIMFTETFKTDVIGFFGDVIMYLTSR